MPEEEIEVTYDGIIATREWDGVIGAGLLSRVFGGLEVDFKNEIRSAKQKILLNVSLIGYVELDSCLIITGKREIPTFFLFGNMIFDGSDYSVISAFVSDIFDLYIPKEVLTALKELENGYTEKLKLSKAMFFSFLADAPHGQFTPVFEMVKEENWGEFKGYFETRAEQALQLTEKPPHQKKIGRETVLQGEGELIYYPVAAGAPLKNKVNLLAIKLQKKKKTAFILEQEDGRVSHSTIVTAKDLDLTPLITLADDVTLERLGMYRLWYLSFSKAKKMEEIKEYLARCTIT